MHPNQKNTSKPALDKPIPGPTGLPLLGNLLDLQREDLLHYFIDASQSYGDVVRFRLGPMEQYLFVHPDHVHHILVSGRQHYVKGMGYSGLKLLVGEGLLTSDGDLWRRQRELMQPSFSPQAVMSYEHIVVSAVQDMLARWKVITRDGAPINVNEEMLQLTINVIGMVLFGMDLRNEAPETGKAFEYVFSYLPKITLNPFAAPLFVPTRGNRRFKQALALIRQFIGEQIEQGRTGSERNGLLSILLHEHGADGQAGMNDKQLQDEVTTLFFAGFETTSRALTWTWYLLSLHVESADKVYAEVDSLLAKRMPMAADVSRLTYQRQVIDEALRLYPPIGLLSRQAVHDDVVGGYRIPARALIVLCPYLTHRHPDFWDTPDKFDPDRFSPARSARRHKYAYYPFGAGPRICLGAGFAMQEISMTVSMVAQQYRLQLVPDCKVEVGFHGTTQPKQPLMMTLQSR